MGWVRNGTQCIVLVMKGVVGMKFPRVGEGGTKGDGGEARGRREGWMDEGRKKGRRRGGK